MCHLLNIGDNLGLKIRSGVNPNNKNAYAWYLVVGYVSVDECNYSVLKLNSQNSITIKFADERKCNNLGISDSPLKNDELEELDFLSIVPDTLVLKTLIEVELLDKLCGLTGRLLVIDSSCLTKEHRTKSILNRGNIRIVRPPASQQHVEP